MKEKGFTLIELLAVIVILVIIALIAVPIILNIIEDSKNSSNKRSIELYGKAVENAVGRYQLKNLYDKDITLEKIQEYIEYKGNKVECEIAGINEDGTIYLDKCKIDNKDVEYKYGKIKSITIYRNSVDLISIGDIINPNDTTKFTKDPNTLGKSFYLKHVVNLDNKVTKSYACIIINNKETCVRGGSREYYGYATNESEYTDNLLILKGLQEQGFSCNIRESSSSCNASSASLQVGFYGSVNASDGVHDCYVSEDGHSRCGV